MLEHKTVRIIPTASKADHDGPGTIEGFGAVFDNVDAGGDLIRQGAFTDVLSDFVYRGFVPIGHAWQPLPVATIDTAREEARGLFFRATFHSTQAAQDARRVATERLERGKFVGLSIGYRVDAGGATRRKDGVRVISRIAELAEISLVMVPLNREAGVTTVKRRVPPKTALLRRRADDLDRLLRDMELASMGIIAWPDVTWPRR